MTLSQLKIDFINATLPAFILQVADRFREVRGLQTAGSLAFTTMLALVPLLHWACGQGLLINGRARRCQVSGCETQTWHPALQLDSPPGRGRGRPDPAAADLTGPLAAEFPEALA